MDKFSNQIKRKDFRTRNYIKQVKYSFILKVFAIICNFLNVPIMINYLGKELYGVWSTLLSMVTWIILMDLGIGNGLKNKITESLAKGSKDLARRYISNSYVAVGFLILVFILFMSLINQFVNWNSIFNTDVLNKNEMNQIVIIITIFVLLNLELSLINQVFNGLQKFSLVNLNQFISSFIFLIFVYILYKTTNASLYKLVIAYGVSLLFSNTILSIWFYRKNYDLKPNLLDFSPEKIKEIVSLGVKFFIIQIAVIIIFTSDKILIIQLFGPEKVTQYDVVFRLFYIVALVHSFISTPLWTAYTDAYHRKDFKWIRNTIRRQLEIFIFFILLVLFLFLYGENIISLWIGEDLNINKNLLFSMSIFIVVSMWNNIFALFINATGNLNIQIITSIAGSIINIPLSIFIVKYFNTDVYGIIIGSIVSLIFFAIFGPIQTYKLLKEGILNEK